MNNLNETPLKIIKNYLLAREQPTNELKEKQMELISILTYDISPNTNTVENYNQNIFKHNYFIRKCHNLIDLIPVKQFRDEWTNIINIISSISKNIISICIYFIITITVI